jgi:Heavy metal binding domain
MKKSVLVIALIASVGLVSFSSCSGEKDKEETSQEQEAKDAYTCPMSECEDGKQYDEPGTCPVCEMELMKVED